MEASDSNKISVSIDKEDIYQINTTPELKSICLIICNRNFNGNADLPGYENDVNRLSTLFRDFGFRIELHENKTADQMRQILNNTRRILNQKQNAFVCILLSHGISVRTLVNTSNGQMEAEGETVIAGVDGNGLLITKDILEMFNNNNCKQFASKPKLFFIQCCRGGQSYLYFFLFLKIIFPDKGLQDIGVEIVEHDSLEPTWNDIFVCYSVINGNSIYFSDGCKKFHSITFH